MCKFHIILQTELSQTNFECVQLNLNNSVYGKWNKTIQTVTYVYLTTRIFKKHTDVSEQFNRGSALSRINTISNAKLLTRFVKMRITENS